MLSRQNPRAEDAVATPLFLGIDFGTSGARYALIDRQGAIHSEAKRAYAPVRISQNSLDHGFGGIVCRFWASTSSCNLLIGVARQVSGDAAGRASSWRAALFQLLGDIPPAHRPSISSISIDGTSATTLIVDR